MENYVNVDENVKFDFRKIMIQMYNLILNVGYQNRNVLHLRKNLENDSKIVKLDAEHKVLLLLHICKLSIIGKIPNFIFSSDQSKPTGGAVAAAVDSSPKPSPATPGPGPRQQRPAGAQQPKKKKKKTAGGTKW
jgi:hypothetical protein